MSSPMELSEKSLETIGRYVRQNLPGWLQQMELPGRREWELQLTERIVRVEEELKVQRELMQQGFAGVDKRLDQIDTRLDQVDKRLDQIDTRLDQVDKRLDQIDTRLDQIQRGSELVEARFDTVDIRLEQADKRLELSTRQISLWMGLITVLITLVGAMGAWGIFAG